MNAIQRFLTLSIFSLLLASSTLAAEEARLLLYPTIHRDFAVFVYAGDVWRVASEGGRAYRLTSHEGDDLTPKISPDGEWVAFSAEYSGSRQVWVVPSAGGAPRQLTYYNSVGTMPPRGGFDYWIQGWRPDGKILVRMNRTPWGERPGRYFLVDPAGGLEEPLPLPIGGSASYSPDGTQLAYTPIDREFRTWKRYHGGRNQDLWIFDLEGMKSTRLTDYSGTDNFPMWHGDTIYFTSDRDRTLNLYAYSLADATVRQLTDFTDYDVLWPSLGPEAIVFSQGGWLWRMDLATEAVTKIPVYLDNDLPEAVPHFVDVAGDVATTDLSPDGQRAVFEARGELFSVPAEHGPTRNLTRSQGVRERNPAWSPDGRWIAYLSDETGELEIWLRSQDGTGSPRQLTHEGSSWRYAPVWSPDGKKLAFGDSLQRLMILDVATGGLTEADHSSQGDFDQYVWSPDSRWIVYEKNHPNRIPGLAAYSLENGTSTMLGDGLAPDLSPAFSPDGQYLFFLSQRDFNLRFSDYEFNYLYDQATRVYAAGLTPEAPALFPLRSDEVAIEKKESEAGSKDKKSGKKSAEEKEEPSDATPRVEIVAEGFAARTVTLPGLSSGNYAGLAAVKGAVLYRRTPADGPPVLYRFDLEKRKESEIASGVASFAVAAEGGKVLFRSGDSWSLAPTEGGEAKPLDLSDLRVKLDPQAEWAQMFAESWRTGRDWFYDEGMHGIDWPLMRERYGALVPYVAHRADLDFILGQMGAELEAGHAYVQRGSEPTVERVDGGLLGAELEADPSGRYRIAKIFPGENWDEAWRSPLTEPGIDVAEGDFLLAIDGVELTTEDNPYRLLEGKGGDMVTLEVGPRPESAGSRSVKVRTVTSEQNLRYLDWVLGRMRLADELSGGKVGYIHLPNTAMEGNRMLQKLFYSQSSKPALIIDDRYNGGGFIPDRMIEMLSRTTMSYWARRGIESFTTPGFAHDGPKAMLINGYAASGGDALPYYFRQAGLGKLFGTTTWGGLIGISGNPMLVDGGGILFPTFRFYDPSGKWAVEGEGVAPDVEVIDLPERIAEGGDPTLEQAVDFLLEELEGFVGAPATPNPADR